MRNHDVMPQCLWALNLATPPPPGNVAPYEILVSGKGRGRLTSHPLPCLLKKVGLQGTSLIIPACGWLSGAWKVWMMAQNLGFEKNCVILRATTRASNDTMAMQALFFFGWVGLGAVEVDVPLRVKQLSKHQHFSSDQNPHWLFWGLIPSDIGL